MTNEEWGSSLMFLAEVSIVQLAVRMENRHNYYRILHVQPDAPTEVIRASYRTLMLRLGMHPDLGGDHWNAALLNEAFATLVDPVKRAQYDATFGRPIQQQRRSLAGASDA